MGIKKHTTEAQRTQKAGKLEDEKMRI